MDRGSSNKNVVAIIPARKGSKGIANKNIKNFCGKPLIYWSIKSAINSKYIDRVYVTSDCDKTLKLSKEYGAFPIKRPSNISGDSASSETAWIHALSVIEKNNYKVDLVVGIQATSPVRTSKDFSKAIELMNKEKIDSLLTVTEVEDNFLWELNSNNELESINYDYRDRLLRQKIKKRYLENGSFYIFKPLILTKNKNRLGGKIGIYKMDKHKSFQIDNPEDIKLCESIMKGYGLDKNE